MPGSRERCGVVVSICCKHGKPCDLASQKVPKSVQAGAEVPKSPELGGGGHKKQHPQTEKNSSFTDLKAATPQASNNSSKTNYENIPQRLPNEYANAGDTGGSTITSETEMTDDNESEAADRPPSVELYRHRLEEDQQLYEDINRPMGIYRCGHVARKNVKKPADNAPRKEVPCTNSREKQTSGVVQTGAWAGCSVPTSTADVKKMEESLTKTNDKVNPKEKLTEFYAGPCTQREAERQCRAAGTFRLYHRIVIDNEDQLQSALPLFIVFRNLHGKFW
ncbi:hypothetical protein Mgra_00008823 [Meloidogyne graminicola]|uniref:Uncharacterized protein n=1 Tax=Meloidogyne graminicola TaxID=189291 RepID=A0A8S9ZEN8_9BILA|nr:hypothetical protein Mgra_00008823 [Meloidogyne graminicola]